MSIYKFRVLVESEKDIFRDIEIKSTQNYEDLHLAILSSFGFDNSQMASFYISDEDWRKGQEIALFDMKIQENEGDKVLVMNNTLINTEINSIGQRLLYTYDFLNMWNFFIELIAITIKEEEGIDYPMVVESLGEAPKQDSKTSDLNNEILEDEKNDDDDSFSGDIFEGFDDFDDYQ